MSSSVAFTAATCSAVITTGRGVDPAAFRAAAEFVVVAAGQRLKVLDHLILDDCGQPAVAPHAPSERRRPLPQVQQRLLLGLVGVNE